MIDPTQMSCNSVLNTTLRKSIRIALLQLSLKTYFCSIASKGTQLEYTNHCKSISKRYLAGYRPLYDIVRMAPPPLQKQYMSSGSKPKKEVGEPRPSSR